MTYENSRVYEGFWHNDKRHGYGYEKYCNGNTYHGQFKQGRAHGKGIYSWITGETYDGNWEEGLKQGQGVWKTQKGDSYSGEWHQSKAHGYGVQIWANGVKHEGKVQNLLKLLERLKFRSIYRFIFNSFVVGIQTKLATNTFASGDVYKGQYINGMPNGEGEYF